MGRDRTAGRTSLFLLWTTALFVVGGSLVPHLKANMVVVYHDGSDKPDDTKPPEPTSAPDSYWKKWDGPLQGKEERRIWLGVTNEASYHKDWVKSVTFTLKGTNLNWLCPDGSVPAECVGGTKWPPPDRKTEVVPSGKVPPEWKEDKGWAGKPVPGATERVIKFTLKPQPDGEWIRLKFTNDDAVLSSAHVATACYGPMNKGKKMVLKTAIKDPPGPMAITEFWWFPDEQALDTSVAPLFIGPPESGNWTSQFVFTDPCGDDRLLGGVKWTTDGKGLMDGDPFTAGIDTLVAGDIWSTGFLYDLTVGSFITMDFQCVPEPSSVVLLVLGLASAMARLKRNREEGT